MLESAVRIGAFVLGGLILVSSLMLTIQKKETDVWGVVAGLVLVGVSIFFP